MNITVLGKPIAQPRQRMRNAGKFIQSYTPKAHPVTAWKQAIKVAYLANKDGKPFDKGDPIRIRINFWMPRPKAHFRANGDLKAGSPKYHVSRPDTDNLAKAVLDALQGAGAFHDDSQVAKLTATKCYGRDLTYVFIEIGHIV